MGAITNFSFLAAQDKQLARLGALAERHFFDDAPSTLIKLRQLGEFMRCGDRSQAKRQGRSGSVDRPLDRIKTFKNDPRPNYVVTVDLLTTGIDVLAIVNLVFVRRVNSRILYDQRIGRAARRCDEIGKDYFRIFDAVDICANLQEVTDIRPVVVNPALTFATLVSHLERAATDDDRTFVRDQIVVKLRQRVRHIDETHRQMLETVSGPLGELADRLAAAAPAETAALFRWHPSLATVLDGARRDRPRDGIYISEHGDELVSVEDDFGGRATPGDYIESFETLVRANTNTVPALGAATQRPRELTRKELTELAVLLDAEGFSKASPRRAYGSTGRPSGIGQFRWLRRHARTARPCDTSLLALGAVVTGAGSALGRRT